MNFDSAHELVQLFLAHIPSKIDDFESAIAKKEVTQIDDLLHNLKGSAGGYGFGNVTKLAAESKRLLSDSNTLTPSVQASLDRLLSNCRKLKTEDSTLLQN